MQYFNLGRDSHPLHSGHPPHPFFNPILSAINTASSSNTSHPTFSRHTTTSPTSSETSEADARAIFGPGPDTHSNRQMYPIHEHVLDLQEPDPQEVHSLQHVTPVHVTHNQVHESPVHNTNRVESKAAPLSQVTDNMPKTRRRLPVKTPQTFLRKLTGIKKAQISTSRKDPYTTEEEDIEAADVKPHGVTKKPQNAHPQKEVEAVSHVTQNQSPDSESNQVFEREIDELFQQFTTKNYDQITHSQITDLYRKLHNHLNTPQQNLDLIEPLKAKATKNFKEAQYEQNVITLAEKLCQKKLKRNASEISKSFLNTLTNPTQKYEKQISNLKTQIKASKTRGFFKQMMEDRF